METHSLSVMPDGLCPGFVRRRYSVATVLGVLAVLDDKSKFDSVCPRQPGHWLMTPGTALLRANAHTGLHGRGDKALEPEDTCRDEPTWPGCRHGSRLVGGVGRELVRVPGSSAPLLGGYLGQGPTDPYSDPGIELVHSPVPGVSPGCRCCGRQPEGAYNGKGPRSFDRGPFSLLTLSQVI